MLTTHKITWFLTDVVARVYCIKRVLQSILGSLYKRTVGIPLQPLHVYKVVRYNEDEDTETDETIRFLNGRPIILPKNEYLEFRVQWLNKKYRYLTSEMFDYPCISNCVKAPQFHQMAIQATLFNHKDGLYEDVLDRIRKFQGPCYDQFDRTIVMKQMFMNDDLDEDMKLMVVTRCGEIHTYGIKDAFDLKK